MKLGKLNDGRFNAALAKLTAQPMPLRAAFKLKGITAKIQEESKKFEEVRQTALKQYGAKSESGELLTNEDGTVRFNAAEDLQAFAKELNELSAGDIEVGTISLGELGDKTVLTGDEVFALDGVLVE